MKSTVIGIALLIGTALFAWIAIQLHTYGIPGCLRRSADRDVRRAAKKRALASTYELAAAQFPPILKDFHAEELKRLEAAQ